MPGDLLDGEWEDLVILDEFMLTPPLQTVAPLCAEVAGLKEVPSFLSLQWLTAILPTTFAEVRDPAYFSYDADC